MSLTFAVLAGEASGDAQGAALVKAIRARSSDASFVGIGGPAMKAAGVELLYDSSKWGAIGIVESLRLVRPLTRAKDDIVQHFSTRRPDLVIPIDFGYFNVRAAQPLRAAGCRVLYYFPPRSWSRDARISSSLRESVDAVATPFPWSAVTFRAACIPAAFVGHPLLDLVAQSPDREALCAEWDLDPIRPIAALLPGSRAHEVKFLWPRLIMAAARVAAEDPAVQFITPVAPTVDRSWIDPAKGQESLSRSVGAPLRLVDGRSSDVLALADVVATCSGTATLEAAVRQKPMTALYGGSWLMGLEWKLRRRRLGVTYIAMPNIIAGKEVVTELIGEAATPAAIAAELYSLLTDRLRVDRMRTELKALSASLGSPGAVARTAEMAVSMARGTVMPLDGNPFNAPCGGELSGAATPSRMPDDAADVVEGTTSCCA